MLLTTLNQTLNHQHFQRLEVRASNTTGGPGVISGWAARWNTPTQIYDWTETLNTASLDHTGDVVALYSHHPERLLGRTSSHTLTLETRRDGLWYSLTLPDTTDGHRVAVLAKRGDLAGMSIGFANPTDTWTNTPTGLTRQIVSATLLEVSPVVWPAYPDTTLTYQPGMLGETKEGVEDGQTRLDTGHHAR